MDSKNAEAGRGRHPVPASNNFVSTDNPQYKPARPTKQANLLANCFGRPPLKIGRHAIQSRAARSKIVKLVRVFRSRLEIEHRQSTSSEDWIFAFEHVGDQRRRFLGSYGDVAAAFNATLAWLNQSVRIVCIERVRP